MRAPFFVGAGFGVVALLTLFSSITARSLAELATRPTTLVGVDDTPVETELDLYSFPEDLR